MLFRRVIFFGEALFTAPFHFRLPLFVELSKVPWGFFFGDSFAIRFPFTTPHPNLPQLVGILQFST